MGFSWPLFVAWMIVVLKADSTPADNVLAPSALAILSLMPVYHRSHDTRMLLITLLAIPVIFQKSHIVGAAIAILTALAVLSLQYRLQLFFLHQGTWGSILQHKLLFVLLLRQLTLELLLLFFLYLLAIWKVSRPAKNPVESLA